MEWWGRWYAVYIDWEVVLPQMDTARIRRHLGDLNGSLDIDLYASKLPKAEFR